MLIRVKLEDGTIVNSYKFIVANKEFDNYQDAQDYFKSKVEERLLTILNIHLASKQADDLIYCLKNLNTNERHDLIEVIKDLDHIITN